MITMIATIGLCMLAAAAPTTLANSTLERGIKRETALLISERDALRSEAARMTAVHNQRSSSLQREVASLEARVVAAAQGEEAARQALAAPTQPADNNTIPTSTPQSMSEAMSLLGMTTSNSDPVAAVVAAIDKLRIRTGLQRTDGGFFDGEGSWQQGTLAMVGAHGIAASTSTAGALLPAVDGAQQLSADNDTAVAARAILAGQPPPLWPLTFPTAEQAQALQAPSLMTRLLRLGSSGPLLLMMIVGVLLSSLWWMMRAWRMMGAIAAVDTRLPALVSSGDVAAATGLARTVPGVAGRFLQDVLHAAIHPQADDEVAALSAQTLATLDRSRRWAIVLGAGVAAATMIIVAQTLSSAIEKILQTSGEVPMRALLDAMAVATLPLQMVGVAALPWLIMVMVLDGCVSKSKERLDVTSLRILDASFRRE